MATEITGRNFEVTPDIRKLLVTKIAKVQDRLFDDVIDVRCVLQVQKYRNICEILIVGKELGQRSGFAILLLRRRNVDETKRLRQPAGTIEKALGLFGHIGLLQMVDQLRRRLALGFPDRFEDAEFCDPAEIVVDGWSPTRLDHVEPNGPREDIRVIKPGANAVD